MKFSPIRPKQDGYTMVEISIATAILGILVMVGIQAYLYFNKGTQQKVAELSTIQQFNLLTKDMLGFSESAGLSTIYLNMPVRIQSCEAGRPCLRQRAMVGTEEQWVDVATNEIPQIVRDEQCLQFYRDSHGKPLFKPAFPGATGSSEEISTFRDFNYTPGDKELALTWPMIDKNSAPFLLMKVRNVADFFSLNAGLSFSRDSLHSNFSDSSEFRAAVFDSSMSAEQAQQYVGYPMLFYGSQYQSHFGLYSATSIISCREDRDKCLQEIEAKIYKNPSGTGLPVSISSRITQNSFVISLRPIDQSASFFSEIYDRVNVPAGTSASGCQHAWGNKQDAAQYIFPNGLLSIYNSAVPASDVNTDSHNYYNPSSYNKYAAYEMANSSNQDPFAQLIPIDLIRYSIEPSARSNKGLDLVAQLWHATEVKKLLKISNLSAPFYFTRKLGSSEFGIEYSPKSSGERAQTGEGQ